VIFLLIVMHYLTNFMNLKIKLTQSFEGTHEDRMCIRVFIKMSTRTCFTFILCYIRKKIENFRMNMDEKKNCPLKITFSPKLLGDAIILGFLLQIFP
jgi:hypothetical protein